MPTHPKPLTIAQYTALQTALPTVCATAVLTLDGQTYTASALTALVTSVLEAERAVVQARASWVEALDAARTAQATSGRTVREAREVLRLMFKTDLPALTSLGIDPPKTRARLSSEARLAATEKLRATRLARGTKSKKQLSRIKGGVTGVTVTPVVSSAPKPEGQGGA